MALLAVTYHYFAPSRSADARAIFPVTVEELAAQLELLARAFEFVSRDDLVAAIAGTRSLPENACAITFDDGLRSQYELALPVLDELGVPGIFFVSSAPLEERRVLHVHRVHWTREHLAPDTFAAAVHEEIERRGVHVDERALEAGIAMYRYDDPATARLKFLLQHGLPRDAREHVALAAFELAGGDEESLFDELYLDSTAVVDLGARGALGAHAATHHALGHMPAREVRHELAACRDVLARLSGEPPLLLSYPFGADDTVTVETSRLAAEAGFVGAFTTERCVNQSLDAPLLLGRIDANDAPGGRRPLAHIDDGHLLLDGLADGRRRYFDETSGAVDVR